MNMLNNCLGWKWEIPSSVSLWIVLTLASTQFIALGCNINFQGTILEVSIKSMEAKVAAGFCLGFTVIILADLLLDFFMKNFEHWTSRLGYFLLIFFNSMLFLVFPESEKIGVVYMCYSNFFTISLLGLSFLDLCRLDSSKTWTVSRSLFLIALACCSLLLGEYSFIGAGSNQLRTAGLVVRYTTVALYVMTCGVCAWRLTRGKLVGGLRLLWDRLTHDEVLTILVMSTVVVCSVSYGVIPSSIIKFQGVPNATPAFIYSSMIIQLLFTTSLALLPSLAMKYKAIALQLDLDVKRGFVRYVSHEIRTPLNIVSAGLQLMHIEMEKKAGCGEIVDLIVDCRGSTEVAVSILNDLLAYEKLDSNLMTVETTETCLVPFLVASARPFELSARAANVELVVCSSTAALGHVYADIDKSKIAQVLRNFISNALKFTPAGGRVDVYFELSRNYSGSKRKKHASISANSSVIFSASIPDTIRVCVKDSGYGIEPENRSRVFTAMTQFNASAQQGGGGSGLGLYVSKKIVELHSGSVGFVSEGVGRGSMFFFELPLSRLEQQDLAVIDLASRGSFSDPDLNLNRNLDVAAAPAALHILVVDDSALNRRMTGKILSLLNHSFIEADDGDVAVEIIKASIQGDRDVFHCVLLDNFMVRLNGTAACATMRSLGYKGMIIGVTGNALPEDISGFIASGADDVLIKPAKLEDIQSVLSRQNIDNTSLQRV